MAVGAITRRGQPGAPLPVLSRAVAFWKASEYSGSGDLLDLSGNGHHAVLGAGAAAPTFLPHYGVKYLYFPGVAGNFASVPDAANLDITGAVEIRVAFMTDDMTPATTMVLGGKSSDYTLKLTSGGTYQFAWHDGVLARTLDGSAFGLAGALILVRAAWTPTGGTGGVARLSLYSKASTEATAYADLVSAAGWTLEENVEGLAASTIRAGTDLVRVGSLDGTTQMFTGRVYGLVVHDNAGGGTNVLTIDPNDATEPYASFVCDSGQTVTLARSTTGRKTVVVDRDMFLFGTNDYMEVADNPNLDFGASESFTAVIALRRYGTPTATNSYIGKKVALTSSAGWSIVQGAVTTATFRIGDGVNTSPATSPTVTSGLAQLLAAVRNVTTDQLVAYVDTTSGTLAADTTTGSLANAEAFRFGRRSGADTDYGDFELIGGAVFREALTAADIASLNAEFGTNA